MEKGFLFQKADIAPLAAFRILMGLLMSAEGFGAIITGWVRQNYVEPDYAFPFINFEFLHILLGPQAYVVYALLGIFGLCIAFGYRYRLSVIGYTILWAAVYFGQKTSYNNHYYLLLLFCFLLCLIPAHRYASLDVRQGRTKLSQVTPYWTIWIFKILLLVVYFYASTAKLYPDWLEGRPIKIFLSNKSDWPLLGPLVDRHWFIMLLSYGGIAFDFLVIPALWYKPTRKAAFIISIGFHLFNSIVFQIGIFPYMMLIVAVLFFEPAYIRNLFFRNRVDINDYPAIQPLKPYAVKAILVPFLVMNFLLPIRHFYFPGNVHWSEEGHRLSWHMMLRSKQGHITFKIKVPHQETVEQILPTGQLWNKMARKMATHPDMIWQYVQQIKKQYAERGYENIEIYAVSNMSLNRGPYRPLIDQKTDLAKVEWYHFKHNDWILIYPDL